MTCGRLLFGGMKARGWMRLAGKMQLMVAIILSEGLALALPDLVVDKHLLRTTVFVERQGFNTGTCDYQEGCVRAAGVRKLLRVAVGLANIGPDDLVIGAPEDNPDLFEYSPCHEHYHLRGMVRYRVLNLSFAPVIKARKQAFCMEDDYPYADWAAESSGYTCGNQGITSGWEDIYETTLDCQYVDITGMPAGNYYLEVTVNPARIFAEENYANNKVIVFIKIPRLPR
jgi:hypothetical protein